MNSPEKFPEPHPQIASSQKTPEDRWEALVAAARTECPPVIDLRKRVRAKLMPTTSEVLDDSLLATIASLFRGRKTLWLLSTGSSLMAAMIALAFLVPSLALPSGQNSNGSVPYANSPADDSSENDSLTTYLQTGDWTDLLEIPELPSDS